MQESALHGVCFDTFSVNAACFIDIQAYILISRNFSLHIQKTRKNIHMKTAVCKPWQYFPSCQISVRHEAMYPCLVWLFLLVLRTCCLPAASISQSSTACLKMTGNLVMMIKTISIAFHTPAKRRRTPAPSCLSRPIYRVLPPRRDSTPRPIISLSLWSGYNT